MVREQLQGDRVKGYVLFMVKVGLLQLRTCDREAKPALASESKSWPLSLLSFPYSLLAFSYTL